MIFMIELGFIVIFLKSHRDNTDFMNETLTSTLHSETFVSIVLAERE